MRSKCVLNKNTNPNLRTQTQKLKSNTEPPTSTKHHPQLNQHLMTHWQPSTRKPQKRISKPKTPKTRNPHSHQHWTTTTHIKNSDPHNQHHSQNPSNSHNHRTHKTQNPIQPTNHWTRNKQPTRQTRNPPLHYWKFQNRNNQPTLIQRSLSHCTHPSTTETTNPYLFNSPDQFKPTPFQQPTLIQQPIDDSNPHQFNNLQPIQTHTDSTSQPQKPSQK